jgi:PhoPQ-activated pathogenicity-related protein
MVKAAY